MDFWHTNSTGVYGGYAAEGTTGLTWLHGLGESDHDGVIQITTKFPSHYNGKKTTHQSARYR